MAKSEQSHTCDACVGTGVYRVRGYAEWSCWVCAGVGTISDRMPVADALADAETLREFAMDGFPYKRSAKIMALREVLRNMAVLDPEQSARAAFRAVPGLRGRS